MKNNTFLTILFLLLLASSFAQNLSAGFKFPSYDIDIHKFGPYIGIQRGKFSSIEFGAEYQFKEVKLIRPITQAAHFGFNYNLYKNVLGYDLGYWIKQGRLNLSYGANIIYRTDYNKGYIGIAPVLGYKLAQFHLQTGINLLPVSAYNLAINKFFMSLRFVLIQHRNMTIEKE
jgi:hypothetical protein